MPCFIFAQFWVHNGSAALCGEYPLALVPFHVLAPYLVFLDIQRLKLCLNSYCE